MENVKVDNRTDDATKGFLGRIRKGIGNFFKSTVPRRFAMGSAAAMLAFGATVAPAMAASANEGEGSPPPDAPGIGAVADQPDDYTQDLDSGTITVTIENPDQTSDTGNEESPAEAPAGDVAEQEQPQFADETPAESVDEGADGSYDPTVDGPIVDDEETEEDSVSVEEQEPGDGSQGGQPGNDDASNPPNDGQTGSAPVEGNGGNPPAEEEQQNSDGAETTTKEKMTDVEPVEIDGKIYYKWEETTVFENGDKVTTTYWENEDGEIITTDEMDNFYLKIDDNKWNVYDPDGRDTYEVVITEPKGETPPEESEEPPEEPPVPEETPTPPPTPEIPGGLPVTGSGNALSLAGLALSLAAMGTAIVVLSSKRKRVSNREKPPETTTRKLDTNNYPTDYELLHSDKYALERFVTRALLEREREQLRQERLGFKLTA
jgi:hypothetical protein